MIRIYLTKHCNWLDLLDTYFKGSLKKKTIIIELDMIAPDFLSWRNSSISSSVATVLSHQFE